jgi:hypothetical protein
MSTLFQLQTPVATLDEDGWEDLLNYIEERRVVPIIGPELLKVETDTGPRLLYDWLAERLAGKLNVCRSPKAAANRGSIGSIAAETFAASERARAVGARC